MTFQTPIDADLTITLTNGTRVVGDVIASGPAGCTLLTSKGERYVSQSDMTHVVSNDVLNARSIQRIKFDNRLDVIHSIAKKVDLLLSLCENSPALALKRGKGVITMVTNRLAILECLEQMVEGTTSTFNEELAIKHGVALAANADLDDDSLATFIHFGYGQDGQPKQTIEVKNKQKEAPRFYSASGYGSKIPCDTMVKYLGHWRRVYAVCWSSCATHYINVKGEKFTVSFY